MQVKVSWNTQRRSPFSRGPKCRAVLRYSLHTGQLTRNSTRKNGQKDPRSRERDSHKSKNWNEKGPGHLRIALFDGFSRGTINRCTEGMKVNTMFFVVGMWYRLTSELFLSCRWRKSHEGRRVWLERLRGVVVAFVNVCIWIHARIRLSFVHGDRSCLILLPFSLLLFF